MPDETKIKKFQEILQEYSWIPDYFGNEVKDIITREPFVDFKKFLIVRGILLAMLI